jgi:ubiquinone/menaquinone biosynthesis C-methylase UbiE
MLAKSDPEMEKNTNIDYERLTTANTVLENLVLWSNYDWSNEGREWCHSEAWAKSVIQYIMLPELKRGGACLEIGCGAGFWSAFLARICRRLVLVDIVEECLEICRSKFRASAHVEYYRNNGVSLRFLDDASIDSIWSWNTFININERDTKSYFQEFRRVMRPNGIAVIHHPAKGATSPKNGWRSDVTDGKIHAICHTLGLNVIKQFRAWGPDRQFLAWPHLTADQSPDSVSVISRS